MFVLIFYVFSVAGHLVATGVRLEVTNASVAYVDQDRSALSRQIAGAILPPNFKPPEEIRADAVDAAMDSGRSFSSCPFRHPSKPMSCAAVPPPCN